MFNNVFRDPDNLTETRKHQIDTLKIFNDNVTEVVKDHEYNVEFECDGRKMTLIVILEPKFPLENPILKIKPPVTHPWITNGNEVSWAPGLMNFTVHSDLGRVVQAIVREFELRPPPIFENPINSSANLKGNTGEAVPVSSCSITSGNTYLYSAPNSNTLPYCTNKYGFDKLSPSAKSIVSALFPFIKNMTLEELKDLLDDTSKMDALIGDLPPKQTLDDCIDDLINTINDLAERNLKLEPKLEALKEEINTKLELLTQRKADHDKCSLEYQKLCERFCPQNIKEKLQESVTTVDEESERVAENFLDGHVELDEFLSTYTNHRMVSYSRKVKDEKLSQQLEKLHRAGF